MKAIQHSWVGVVALALGALSLHSLVAVPLVFGFCLGISGDIGGYILLAGLYAPDTSARTASALVCLATQADHGPMRVGGGRE